LINRLKGFEKALARLHDECRRSADVMHDFLPHDTLEYVGRSLTFTAMGEALGKNVIPPNFDHKMEVKRSVGERITIEFVEEFSRPSREALGLRLAMSSSRSLSNAFMPRWPNGLNRKASIRVVVGWPALPADI
jgi:hypothetical protein